MWKNIATTSRLDRVAAISGRETRGEKPCCHSTRSLIPMQAHTFAASNRHRRPCQESDRPFPRVAPLFPSPTRSLLEVVQVNRQASRAHFLCERGFPGSAGVVVQILHATEI